MLVKSCEQATHIEHLRLVPTPLAAGEAPQSEAALVDPSVVMGKRVGGWMITNHTDCEICDNRET